MRFTHVVVFTVLGLIPATARSQALPPEPRPLGVAELPPASQPAPRPSDGLALSDLEQTALANNPALLQARARVQAARGIWTQVGLYPNPVIGYSADEMGDEGMAGQQGGSIGQQLITGGKLRWNRAVASREIERLQQELAIRQWRVLTDVRTHFDDVLVAQRRIELTEQLVKIGEEGVATAEALIKAQEASRVDLLQARVEVNSTKILLTNAQKAYLAAWRMLVAVLGDPKMQPRPLLGNVEDLGPPLAWEEVLGRLVSESPELAAARAEVGRARCALQRARVEWIPDVGVDTTVAHDNSTGYDIANLGVTLPLPLFNRNQGNIAAASAELVAAQRNVERIRLDIQRRLAETFERYAGARNQVEQYKANILPDAKASLDMVVAGYQQGEFGYLSLLTAQRTFFQSNLAYIGALKELKSASAEIEGFLLKGSLEDRR